MIGIKLDWKDYKTYFCEKIKQYRENKTSGAYKEDSTKLGVNEELYTFWKLSKENLFNHPFTLKSMIICEIRLSFRSVLCHPIGLLT